MEENNSILHELYVFSEWKPEAEYLQKSDNILPDNISSIWRWFNFFGPKKSLFDSVTAHKEHQQKWHIALGDEGKVIAVLTDNILEIRTKRSEYATIAARTTVNRDAYPQWRKLVWSPDCSFIVVAYGNGIVSFFDLTASNLFSIPADCPRTGGLECTDNTHAVAEIIFMPLRVKDNKWNWEVLIVTYEGKLRGYLVSQTEGFKLHHTFNFAGGVGAITYCAPHSTLYVAGPPRAKDPTSPLGAGLTAWRILNDDPFYKLSVVSDRLETQLANERFQLYIPFLTAKNLAFIVYIAQSPASCKLVCGHCNGDVTVWSLPLLKLLYRFTVQQQPEMDRRSPLAKGDVDEKVLCLPLEVRWWSDEEIIVSRFSGSVTVCNISDMVNILGKKPEFFQGAPRITSAHNGTFMVLECESNVLPTKKSRSEDSMEMVEKQPESDGSVLEMSKEVVKSILYAITDIETFQPKPKKITVVSRIYRLLGVKSTTPEELFSRKIESGSYKEALALAETFHLDSDLVYQQQWRKNPVSTDAIRSYLSKVSKKIWVVHQCVDRLPETMPAAKELLQFGLELTIDEILEEINKNRIEDEYKLPDDIVLEDLNAYTSELLRCRHVMLFYRERLRLYEEILRSEKSTYLKDEYDRLRSNSIIHSATEIAKEGRIEALTCLWQHIKTVPMQFAVLDKLPETMNPMDYKHLLPTKEPVEWSEEDSPIKVKPQFERDWCRKPIFQSIWSSNWSEDSPDVETNSIVSDTDLADWYNKRARAIEERSGIVSHALTLISIATLGGGVTGLDQILFHLITLDTLVYDINVEGVTLKELEKMSTQETAMKLMQMSTPATFISDLKNFVIPYLKRYEHLTKTPDACLSGLTDYLECISIQDLSPILLVLQSPNEFELDVRTHLELAEKCLFAYSGTEQLDKACDLLDTILKETDGSISPSELIRRAKRLESIVWGSTKLSWRGVKVTLKDLSDTTLEQANRYLAGMARGACKEEEKLSPQEWEKLRRDIMELQSTLFTSVTKEKCNEIYASALLTSGDVASIRLASDVLTNCAERRANTNIVNYARSVDLVLAASREYFNSASSLVDPALQKAKCCLSLIKDENNEIKREEDLIAALQILSEFNMTLLPIEVRLRDDKMTLVEECLKLEGNAYQASHKLLKLAALMRVAGEDEHAREGLVLQLVCRYALSAGPPGLGAAVTSATRLCALHYPSSQLLTQVAAAAKVHSDIETRRLMLAAAALNCPASDIEGILTARLGLELEVLDQMGAVLDNQYQSTDDEFADAITTPVVERKDLVAPNDDTNVSKLNRLIENLQHKYKLRNKSTEDRTPHCLEFYRSLYPEHTVSDSFYRYDRFSLPDFIDETTNLGYALVKMFYTQNCLDISDTVQLEADVVQTCAQELLYKDTPLAVACLLRSSQEYGPTKTWVDGNNVDTAINAALYATLVRCNSTEMKDNVYLTKPSEMARATLEKKTASEEQMDLIRQCIDKLTGMGEVDRIRRLGFTVNGLMFNADEDYRRETIYMLARSEQQEHLELACSLAAKYGMDMLETCLQHGAKSSALLRLASLVPAILPPQAYTRIHEVLYPQIPGADHSALLNYFALLKSVNDKELIRGLTASEHMKLLKKAKAASTSLNYKILIDSQPQHLTEHICSIMKPENAGMMMKFVRTLPAPLRLDASVHDIYSMWLTSYFFSALAGSNNNKRWMQQYRQCASYFNKLNKDSLMHFIQDTCFSEEGVKRVPSGTRVLMVMQAVDYCHQEQENEVKLNKDEQTWGQVAQELTRWARFLENFHSSAVQSIVSGHSPRDEFWPEIEMSHGQPSKFIPALGRLVLLTELKSSAVASLLQCLHVDSDLQAIFDFILQNLVKNSVHLETLIRRVTQYAREGVPFTEDMYSRIGQKAGKVGLVPHNTLRLLSTSGHSQPTVTNEKEVARVTADILKASWPGEEAVSVESLETDAGRREVFNKYILLLDTWERKRAFIDMLNCWPPIRTCIARSLHSLYLNHLLCNDGDQIENLVLIKLLLNRPVLDDKEVKWLCEKASSFAVINSIWVVLLSKCENDVEEIKKLAHNHRDSINCAEIDDDLIKTLLDRGMFTKLVSTKLYVALVGYVISHESDINNTSSTYTPEWAATELRNANLLAEAGQLLIVANGVPAGAQGFSEAVHYSKRERKRERRS